MNPEIEKKMEEVRGKIALMLWIFKYPSWISDLEYIKQKLEISDSETAKEMLAEADQILSLPIPIGGGVCPRCHGVKPPPETSPAFKTGYLPCPTCNGTGSLPVKTMTIKEIIEEALRRWI